MSVNTAYGPHTTKEEWHRLGTGVSQVELPGPPVANSSYARSMTRAKQCSKAIITHNTSQLSFHTTLRRRALPPTIRFRVEAWHDEMTHGSWTLLVTEGQMEDMENVRLSQSIPKIHRCGHRMQPPYPQNSQSCAQQTK
jgi:hypothetical protein